MKSFKFHGGAHPRYNKRQSQYFKIEDIGAPAQVILPVLQHIGKPAKPIVKQGDRVLFGQKIAEGQGDVSASIHSSVSGIVEKIAPHVHPGGEVVSSIFIKNDFKNLKHPSIKPRRHFSELTAPEIVASVREAGVVGMGGAAFPTHVKLAPQPDKKIKNLIINGCECEPYLTSDHRVMLEYPEKLVLGILAISRVVTPEKIYIAIEDNKKDAIETMQQYTKEIENIEVVRLPTRYPQGSEKQLIYSILGVEVAAGQLPADVGCLVHNVDSCVAVAEAMEDGSPLTHRIVTVSGSCFAQAQNYRVPIGTTISHIVEFHGGFRQQPKRVLLGGPMMGMAQVNLDVPIIKGTGALLALSNKDTNVHRETNCLRCGRCVSGCPVRLRPINLAHLAQKSDADGLRAENIVDCIECGVCTYHCPAKIHLLQWIRSGKSQISD